MWPTYRCTCTRQISTGTDDPDPDRISRLPQQVAIPLPSTGTDPELPPVTGNVRPARSVIAAIPAGRGAGSRSDSHSRREALHWTGRGKMSALTSP
jgi:hypothetical protein